MRVQLRTGSIRAVLAAVKVAGRVIFTRERELRRDFCFAVSSSQSPRNPFACQLEAGS